MTANNYNIINNGSSSNNNNNNNKLNGVQFNLGHAARTTTPPDLGNLPLTQDSNGGQINSFSGYPLDIASLRQILFQDPSDNFGGSQLVFNNATPSATPDFPQQLSNYPVNSGWNCPQDLNNPYQLNALLASMAIQPEQMPLNDINFGHQWNTFNGTHYAPTASAINTIGGYYQPPQQFQPFFQPLPSLGIAPLSPGIYSLITPPSASLRESSVSSSDHSGSPVPSTPSAVSDYLSFDSSFESLDLASMGISASLGSPTGSPTSSIPCFPPTQDLSQDENFSEEASQRAKRKRNAIELKTRAKIFLYAKENPGTPIMQIAKKFDLKRTTTYGILKSGQSLLARPQLPMSDSYRISESRFKVLEHVLIMWLKDLQSRQAQFQRMMVMAQAWDIYCMLFGLTKEELPPCLFTSGWYNGLVKRRSELKIIFGKETRSRSSKCEFTKKELLKYAPDDIYACEMTSMFLSFAALGSQDHKGQTRVTKDVDSSAASIVFCFNASGTDKKVPLVLVRQRAKDTVRSLLKRDDSHEYARVARGDLTKAILLNWLLDFDESLNRKILLVVDQVLWRILHCDKNDVQNFLRNITIITVSAAESKDLPVSAGIARVFKTAYYWALLDALRSNTQPGSGTAIGLGTLREHLALILQAWEQIPCHSIKLHFDPFLESLTSHVNSASSRAKNRDDLCKALKQTFPEAQPTMIQYYASLGKENGPSRFLQEVIQSMAFHKDFSDCFEKPDFGALSIAKLPCSRSSPSASLSAAGTRKPGGDDSRGIRPRSPGLSSSHSGSPSAPQRDTSPKQGASGSQVDRTYSAQTPAEPSWVLPDTSRSFSATTSSTFKPTSHTQTHNSTAKKSSTFQFGKKKVSPDSSVSSPPSQQGSQNLFSRIRRPGTSCQQREQHKVQPPATDFFEGFKTQIRQRITGRR